MKKVIINENQKGFLFKNGKYINPLTFESPSAEPVSSANKAAFEETMKKYESMMN